MSCSSAPIAPAWRAGRVIGRPGASVLPTRRLGRGLVHRNARHGLGLEPLPQRTGHLHVATTA